MAVRFVRIFLVAVTVFTVIIIVDELGLPVSQGITNYLEFVLETDFNMQPFVEQLENVGISLQRFDFAALLQGLPRITTGR